jgi:glycosyltransferase involved in cell wall biosynthesis
MKVSIITPTYNRRVLACRAVSSALKQDGAELDVIVVDDGSTDGTREAIEQLRGGSIPLRYIWKPNGGCASARNVGLHEITGDAFIFLDSDDVLEPGAISSLVKVLTDSGADFVYAPAIEVYANGKEHLNLPVAAERPEELAKGYFMLPNVKCGAALFRRHVIDGAGYVDESLRYNEDSDFFQRVSILYRAAYSSTPTVRVYHHSENKSSNRVALHKALITSAGRILKDHPAFETALGGLAQRRLNELNMRLVFAMIMSGQYEEARHAVKTVNGPMALVARAAVASRSRWPVVLVELVKRVRARLAFELTRSAAAKHSRPVS